jgi:uncharacterized glyoxalase superfamily protein PhnB
MTTTHHPKTVWPALNNADAPAAIRMLVDGFGFEERLVVTGDDPQVVEHAELRWPKGGDVMLGTADRDGNEFSRRPTGTAAVHIATDAVDAVFERATAAGAGLVTGPGRPGLRRAHRNGARPRGQPMEPRVVPGRVTTASACLDQGVLGGREPEPTRDL